MKQESVLQGDLHNSSCPDLLHFRRGRECKTGLSGPVVHHGKICEIEFRGRGAVVLAE